MTYLMQDLPLRVGDILFYAAQQHGRQTVLSRDEDGQLRKRNYAQTLSRATQLVDRLLGMNIPHQSRIGSLALNTQRHLELYYGVTGAGAILHTINPRFTEEQIIFTIQQAEDNILFFDPSFSDLVARIRSQIPSITQYVYLDTPENDAVSASVSDAISYEEFISLGDPGREWPTFSERDGAFLCYTSGTTGNPKGVLYAHRSCMIHAMAASLPGAFNMRPQDVVLPCASMYHATAWALPLTTPLAGAALVLPGAQLDGETLRKLSDQAGVTLACGVPTIWKTYLDALKKAGTKPSTLERLFVGGSAVPPDLAQELMNDFGVRIIQVWGMTETSPLGVIATPSPALLQGPQDQCAEKLASKQGRISFGIDLKITDPDGRKLPHDGKASGTLKVRGPWVVNQYFGHSDPITDPEGWFDTGDIATIDSDGFMQITDRAKDIIKSGGEWISSIDLENLAMEHPDIALAAAIGIPHPKWDERPLLVLQPAASVAASSLETTILEYMRERLPKWQLPEDAVILPELPLTSTGKVDKLGLRRRFAHHYSA